MTKAYTCTTNPNLLSVLFNPSRQLQECQKLAVFEILATTTAATEYTTTNKCIMKLNKSDYMLVT